MAELSITNVVTVSVSAPQKGLSAYNVNNIALFTDETPEGSFGSDGYKIYKGISDVITDFGSDSKTVAMATNIFLQTPNMQNGNGYLVIIPLQDEETLAAAYARAKGLVDFCGIVATKAFEDADVLAAGALITADRKLYFPVYSAETALTAETGIIAKVTAQKLTGVRCLFYTVAADANKYAAAYVSRALSTNFSGSNTVQTMHLKDLAGVEADKGMTETLLQKCQTAGADVYANIAGVAKVFCSGANDFFDNVYNLNWFVGQVEVALFNRLATVSTKIPQTEAGMSLLKESVELICQKAINNGFVAAGKWNSADLFGNPEDLRRCVLDYGYYIYSQPIVEQDQTEREARQAPLIQVAIKYAGAIHKVNAIIYINK